MDAYLTDYLIDGRWYISDSFKTLRSNPATEGQEIKEKMIEHNKKASEMRLSGPYDTREEATTNLSRYSDSHHPFVWQHSAPEK